LAVGSLALATGVAEIVLRLFTPFPVHAPMANRVYDARLGYRLDSTVRDADSSGFRNPRTLDSADIVATFFNGKQLA
jgi:hypothetical protein